MFSGFTTILWREECFLDPVEMAVLPGRGVWEISVIIFVKLGIRGSAILTVFCWRCYEQETQRSAKVRSVSKYVCYYWQPREKGMSVLLRYIRGTEKEFLFGTSKPFFLDMHRFHFLSEASRKIVIYFFIYSISCLFFFFCM